MAILRIDANGNFHEMEKIETKNPYLRINLNYLTMPGTYYVISEIDPTTSITVGTSDTVPILVNPGYNPWLDVYSKPCNGNTYAYQITLKQQLINPDSEDGSYSINQPAKFEAQAAFAYADPTQGIYIPYYQAIDISLWNQLEALEHPYTQLLGGNPLNPRYKHFKIINNSTNINGSVVGGPFFDAQGSPVTNGMLVEKKMDQFTHFQGDQTTIFSPPSTILDNSFSSWNTMFNSMRDVANDGSSPASFNDMPITLQLTCINAPVTPSGGSEGSPNWGDVVEDNIDCFLESDDLASFTDCLDNINDVVQGIYVSPTNGVGGGFVLEYNNILRKFVVSDPNIDLEDVPTGLYFLTYFIQGGKVFQTVFEHNNDEDQREHKDFVQMTISPNPIENDMLVAKLQTSKTMNVRVKVYTLNGEIIANEVVSLTQGTVFTYQKSISGYATPYNQIRVQLIFEDDSSTIQQTGIR